ncbi:cytochrome c oxidase assembly protein [Nocardia arthritidis]|uniref:cytochrome c oxidase assembly protein n=1 Tax=Nocardia arthritidis TaxID=228602 RepID=UPI0007A3F8DD|nr:cytochrome c oxidase assembly protein [Nocardia arthritidis]
MNRWDVRCIRFIAVVVSLSLVVGAVVAMGEAPYRAAGTAYPGLASALCYALLRTVTALAGAVTLGALVYAVCCTRVSAQGKILVDGYAGVLLAERAGWIWSVSALVLIPVTAANVGGLSVSGLVRTGALGALIEASEKPKAWIAVAVSAAVVSLGARLTLSWTGAAVLTMPAAAAVLPQALVGNAGEGPGHDYSTGAMIIFQIAVSVVPGLFWCVAEQLRRGGSDTAVAVRRATVIGVLCLVSTVLSGLVLVVVLLPWSCVVNTGYGRLALLVAAGLVATGRMLWCVYRTRVPNSGTVSVFIWGAAFSAVALSGLVAMAVQPAPAFADRSFTAQEVFLGFELTDRPTLWRLLALWRFDFVLGTVALVGVMAYILGVLRLRRRGDRWSRWRTLSWTGGCLALLVATSSGVGTYGLAMFSMHMITHMALNMFVPVLLVLGAPVTLLLRAVPPAARGAVHGPREWVLALLHARPTAVLAYPGSAIALFVVSLYGLYFTPLFESLIRYHWGHVVMNVHFLVVGYLFYWGIIGIDPGPRRLPHIGRLGMLFAVMPFHAFFGIAMMSMNAVVGQRLYSNLQLPWTIDLLADQRVGGGIAWVSGEVPILLVVGALLTQWVAQDRRIAVRSDRKDDEYGDSDLAAYNAMLEQLARTRR